MYYRREQNILNLNLEMSAKGDQHWPKDHTKTAVCTPLSGGGCLSLGRNGEIPYTG